MAYLLDADNHPVPTNDDLAAGYLLRDVARRRIVVHTLPVDDGREVVLSTVFTVVPEGHDRDGRPLLYQTALLNIPYDGAEVLARFATRDDALAFHEAMLRGHRRTRGEADRTAYDLIGEDV